MIIRSLNLLKRHFSSEYSRAMYEAWRKNPNEVHEDWNIVFQSGPAEGTDAASSPQLER